MTAAALGCQGEVEDSPEGAGAGVTVDGGGTGAAGAAGSHASGGPGADGGTAGTPPDGSAPLGSDAPVGTVGMRRLTAHEYDNVLRDLLGDTSRPAQARLPEEARSPFDNDWRAQQPSRVLVTGLESIATDVAAALSADPTRMASVVGCTPSGTGEACMRDFVGRFTRLAWRRQVTAAEVDALTALGMSFAGSNGSFEEGVEVIVRALLQSAELVYRIELGGAPEGEPFALTDHEVATRISFLLWGSTPDATLLDAADAGELATAAGRRAAATRLLEDPRAREQIDRFHAMWLGYERLPHATDLTAAMRNESRALVERVVFDEARPWTDLFTSTETFLDATLAQHYGLPAPAVASGDWIDTSGSGRQGILSSGAFLSAAANPLDTSPTKRGKLVSERLLCLTVPPPPPDVMADKPPATELAACKADRYQAHRTEARCAGCHQSMDGIGFGLERYDREGRYREVEEDNPACAISGNGELPGQGAFNGPAELSDLLVGANLLDACVVAQLFEFTMGRPAEPVEQPLVEDHAARFADDGRLFDALLLEIVGSDAFAFGRAPVEASP